MIWYILLCITTFIGLYVFLRQADDEWDSFFWAFGLTLCLPVTILFGLLALCVMGVIWVLETYLVQQDE